MSAQPVIERIAASHGARAAGLGGGPEWMRRRARALETLVGRGLPDRRDENWRYLDHARIAQYDFDAVAPATVGAADLAAHLLPLAGARRIVLVDGRLDAGLSGPDAGDGVEIQDLRSLLARDPQAALALLRPPGEDADDRFALLADAFASEGAIVRVDANAVPPAPLYLLHVSTASRPAAHQARIVVDVAAGAAITLVEHFVSLGDAGTFGNLAAEMQVGPGARVTHLRLHQHGDAAAQVETWVTRLADGSHYDQHLVALGGRLMRSNLRLALDGRSAECRLSGLFLADGERQVDLHTQVGHHAAATRTVQDYRGIAAGRGRAAFNGLIVVHPGAHGSDASQSSRNLLLTPLAEINTRPQLEIHVDDVQCRHGATTGTHDPEQYFYLLSRGIDPATARGLLTFAFCHDLVGRIPLPEFRAAVEMRIAGLLPDRELLRGIA